MAVGVGESVGSEVAVSVGWLVTVLVGEGLIVCVAVNLDSFDILVSVSVGCEGVL